MTLYVPAHTSAIGRHALQKYATETWYEYGAQVLVQGHNVLTDVAFKPETKAGLRSSTFPGFKMPTAWSRHVMKTTDLSGGFECNHRTGRIVGSDARTFLGVQFYTNFGTAEFGQPAESANQRNRAVAEALLKVQDARINLGVALAESAKTANMIAARITSLVRFYRALRRGNFSYAYYALFGRRLGVQRGKTAAELWLEWQYGWRPLIDDVWGGVEQIRKGFREGNLLFHVERTVTDPVTPNWCLVQPGLCITQGRAFESTRVKLWGAVTDSASQMAAATGLINPAVIAWELTPYSFVIDWLLPIGSWLESLTATVGVAFVAGHRTYIAGADVTATRTSYERNSGIFPGARLAKARMQLMMMSRTPYNSWPWALPYFKSPFSTSHVTSAVSLLRTTRR